MCKPVDYSDYSSRSRYYYSSLGGVYDEIMNILDDLTDYFVDEEQCTISILNRASYCRDMIRLSPDDENNLRYKLPKEGDTLLLCVLACISPDDKKFIDSIQKQLENDDIYYPRFKDLMEKSITRRTIDFYKNQNKELTDKIQELCGSLDLQRDTIDYLYDIIDHYMESNKETKYYAHDIDQDNRDNISNLDRMLTLDNILKWIEKRQHYQLTSQVFRMLADFKDQVATPEERAKINEAEQRMLAKNQIQAIINEINGNGSTIFTGVTKEVQIGNPTSPQQENALFDEIIKYLKQKKLIGNGNGEG